MDRPNRGSKRKKYRRLDALEEARVPSRANSRREAAVDNQRQVCTLLFPPVIREPELNTSPHALFLGDDILLDIPPQYSSR